MAYFPESLMPKNLKSESDDVVGNRFIVSSADFNKHDDEIRSIEEFLGIIKPLFPGPGFPGVGTSPGPCVPSSSGGVLGGLSNLSNLISRIAQNHVLVTSGTVNNGLQISFPTGWTTTLSDVISPSGATEEASLPVIPHLTLASVAGMPDSGYVTIINDVSPATLWFNQGLNITAPVPAWTSNLTNATPYYSQNGLTAPTPQFTAAGTITAYAGTDHTPGSSGDGGAATAAKLNSPVGVCLDAAGNLYIADTKNHKVRMVALAGGVITTIAGTGVAGSSGDTGPATSAKLNGPMGVFVEGTNLYIADTGNNKIRRVDLVSLIITTFAGNGTASHTGDGGSPTAAGLNAPSFVAADSSNVYVLEQATVATDGAFVRQISGGAIHTIIGGANSSFVGTFPSDVGDDGPALSAYFGGTSASSIVVVKDYQILVTEPDRIRLLSISGDPSSMNWIVTTKYGGNFSTPWGAGVDPRTSSIHPSGPMGLDSVGNLLFLIGSPSSNVLVSVNMASSNLTIITDLSQAVGPSGFLLFDAARGLAVNSRGDCLISSDQHSVSLLFVTNFSVTGGSYGTAPRLGTNVEILRYTGRDVVNNRILNVERKQFGTTGTDHAASDLVFTGRLSISASVTELHFPGMYCGIRSNGKVDIHRYQISLFDFSVIEVSYPSQFASYEAVLIREIAPIPSFDPSLIVREGGC